MTHIAQLVQSVLQDVANNKELAAECERVLVTASFQQLAALTGGQLELDNDGQLVFYTGHYPNGESEDADSAIDIKPYLSRTPRGTESD